MSPLVPVPSYLKYTKRPRRDLSLTTCPVVKYLSLIGILGHLVICLLIINIPREVEQKRMLVERTCKEMKTFQQARLAWRDKQKSMVIAEEKEIEKQAKEQSDRNASVYV